MLVVQPTGGALRQSLRPGGSRQGWRGRLFPSVGRGDSGAGARSAERNAFGYKLPAVDFRTGGDFGASNDRVREGSGALLSANFCAEHGEVLLVNQFWRRESEKDGDDGFGVVVFWVYSLSFWLCRRWA